jgi:hypothetical protein
MMSQSHVSVSGPAAGLIAIILVAVTDLGYETYLAAVVEAQYLAMILGHTQNLTIKE